MHSKPNNKIYRLLEILPGFLVWSAIIVSITLSFIKPLWVIYFIIIYTLFWLFRVIYFVFYILIANHRYHKYIKINWLDKVKNISGWGNHYHLILLPTAGESFEILDTTIQSLKNSNYPNDKMIIILAGEERKLDSFKVISKKIKEKYKNDFLELLITVHPDNIPGEIKAKGANARYASIEAQKYIDKMGIPYEKVIFSYFDCDTAVHKEYLACVTYKYLTHPDPTKSSYQPAVLYNNNMWDASIFTRVAAFGTVFWLLTELTRPDKMFTFSSHSMSFKALVDVDFFEQDVVSDDSRIFLQCFLRYEGNYEVTPIYVPVSMDTVMSSTMLGTFRNLYLQQRRWAWGVENVPYLIWNCFFVKNNIPFGIKLKHTWNQIEGMFSWVTAPVFLLILGRLPLYTIKGIDKSTIIAQNAPFILENLIILSMVGILVSAIISLTLLPPRPNKYTPIRFLVMILQWLILPVSLIVFGAIPALEAQTRLMLGKYLGFWVTEKSRNK